MLAPDPAATIGQLTSIFNSTSLVTSWVHALEDADLRPLNPPPAWYQAINTTLGTAQRSSLSWLTTTGPQVEAGISQSFIDYANFFVAAATELGRLVAKIQQGGNVPTADQKAKLKALASALSTRAASGQTTVQTLLAALNGYRMQMGAIHDSLVSAMDSAMALEENDRQAVQGVIGNLAKLLDANEEALENFTAFTYAWDTTVQGLDALLVVLDQPRIDVTRIPDLLSLPGAVGDWQQIATFAQQVQSAKLQVAGLDLPPVTTAQRALRAVEQRTPPALPSGGFPAGTIHHSTGKESVMTTISPAPAATGGLAPDPASTQATLTSGTNANLVITSYAHALQNTQIAQLTGQGDWYNEFNGNLLLAQQHAQTWVQTLGPKVFSTVPQAIINYSDTFTPAIDDILQILSTIDGVPTPDQQKNITGLINAVLDVLKQERTKLQDVSAALTAFSTRVQTDHGNLLDGQNSAQVAVNLDTTQLGIIQTQINGIQDKIQSDSKKAMEAEIGIGMAIFITAVMITVAVATEGAALPLVAVGVGVLGIGGAIAATVIFSEDVKADLEELGDAMQQFSDEQKQVAALTGITNAINAVVTANAAATEAISSVLDTWAVLGTKLASVIADLNKAEAHHVLAIVEALDLQAAQTAWGQLVTFATGMQTSANSIQVNTVASPPQQQAA